MRITLESSTVSRIMGAAAVLWLGAGSAWAGGGSGDAGTLQSFLTNTLCPALGMSTCPQLFPNVTELVLETAALENAPPEIVRAMNSIAPTVAVNAPNPPASSATSPFVLSNVAPLAFISAQTSGGTVSVTQPGDPSANSFFYAATDGISPTLPPTTLYLVYDYPPLSNPTPVNARGLDLADITIPLTILRGYGTSKVTESSVPTSLRVRGASGSPGYTVLAYGNFPGSPVPASALGLTVTLTFGTSPNSATKHAIFEVQVPLLVTGATDPAYFFNPISQVLPAIFTFDELGSPSNPMAAMHFGMSPVAAQFTATIASTSSGGASLPAVNAYLAIATDGETLVSAPLPK
jgi:hypothetical protein